MHRDFKTYFPRHLRCQPNGNYDEAQCIEQVSSLSQLIFIFQMPINNSSLKGKNSNQVFMLEM